MNSNTKKQIVSAAAEIIFGNEGNYTSVNANDNGALSVGKVQWHGNRALSLLKKIIEETGQTTATTILGSDLWKEIQGMIILSQGFGSLIFLPQHQQQ